MCTTYLEEMNVILSKKREHGKGGIRLFAKDGRDVTSEDIAHDLVKVERARREGRLEVTQVASIDF